MIKKATYIYDIITVEHDKQRVTLITGFSYSSE